MNAIQRLLAPVEFPRMVRIRQTFNATSIADVPGAMRKALTECPAFEAVRPGMNIAITVGSRGLDALPALVGSMVATLKERGAKPFVIPAMGSHGGGTAEGQEEMLRELGVTEASVGCPVRSTMEVVKIGELTDGYPIYMDKYAYGADGVIVFNRIKPHNCFRNKHESGLLKMLAIGLGKHMGAESSHMMGYAHFPRILEEVCKGCLGTGKVLMGVGTVENAYDKVAEIVACGPEDYFETDSQALVRAKASMPKLPIDKLDLLIVDKIGKEFSGGGMDANITGHRPTRFIDDGPEITRIVILDLTEKSKGNATGIGFADVVPQALVDKVDKFKTFTNNITSKVMGGGKIPIHLETEEMVIRCGLKTSDALDYPMARVIRVKNTLHLDDIYVSEALLQEMRTLPHVEIVGEPQRMTFDAAGKLSGPAW